MTSKKITSLRGCSMPATVTGLSDVLTNSYSKAKTYLQRVLQVFPSMEAGNTLERIKDRSGDTLIVAQSPFETRIAQVMDF